MKQLLSNEWLIKIIAGILTFYAIQMINSVEDIKTSLNSLVTLIALLEEKNNTQEEKLKQIERDHKRFEKELYILDNYHKNDFRGSLLLPLIPIPAGGRVSPSERRRINIHADTNRQFDEYNINACAG